MLKKKIFLLFILLALTLFLIACEQPRVRGIRERDVLEAEPEVVVVLADGEKQTLGLEEYVVGVVAGEMKPDWPEDAYAAQAIIARTFAFRQMAESGTNEISGSYQFAQEYKPENITDVVIAAVEKTRGEVAVYNDDYINAWFHASAGGQTTSAQVGLDYEKDEPPYIISVESPDQEAPEDVQNWLVVFSLDEVTAAIAAMGEDVGTVENVSVQDSDETGRAIELNIEGTNGSATVRAGKFRNEIGSKELKSTMITDIDVVEDGFQFSGSGFGHGVGMSQWGAYAFAQEGKSPEEIVMYYFDNIEIVREYD
ncbi:SpoIID/LytB domain-containing protein [Natronospora cellulosivora (SeqCode)]